MTNPTNPRQTRATGKRVGADDTYPLLPRRLRTPRLTTLLHDLRDPHWQVLALLAHEPLLATRHICALLFTEGTPLSAARICRRTLQELTRFGLLHRERPVPARPGGGSEDAVYALSPGGQRLLALREGSSLGRPRRPEERGTAGRRHVLALADLRVALVHACRRSASTLTWRGEPACWWHFPGPARDEVLKPDAYFEVADRSGRRIAWVELDMGTQSVPGVIQTKLRRYCRAARARATAQLPIPRVLVVCELVRRRERIAAAARRAAHREGLDEHTGQALLRVVDRQAAVRELTQ